MLAILLIKPERCKGRKLKKKCFSHSCHQDRNLKILKSRMISKEYQPVFVNNLLEYELNQSSYVNIIGVTLK